MVPAWLLNLFGGKVGISHSWEFGGNPMPESKRIRLLKLTADQVINDFKHEEDSLGNITKTFCNMALDVLCKEVWGFKGFTGMLANQIVDRMKNAPDFAEVGPDAAQNLANDGRMVIAGFKNDPHGHVSAIYPGTCVYSGKWRCNAPMSVNVGKRNGLMGTNYAYQTPPIYWVWIEG